jgi:predicted dehydrogenase
MTSKETKPIIRIGVFGLQRGAALAGDSEELGIKLVAICGRNESKLEAFRKNRTDVAVYTDYDRFLEHEMDAVILANYFHEHAPYAIKALRAGKHVMSEIAACKTIQEGVELCREVEKSGKIYMLAENYPYFSATQEMRKLYMQGVIGDVKYAEGEHVRTVPVEASMRLSPGLGHWRNHCPSTYYSSHALAPLMYMTDTMPVRVSAFSMTDPDQEKTKVKVGDPAAVIVCRMDNGAVFQLVNGNMAGQRVYFKLHGFKGMMETTGAIANSGIRIVRNEWELGPDEYEETAYQTKFPSHASSAKRAGHGGGDFWTRYHFAEAVRSNKQPYLDVYKGVAMAAVALRGARFQQGRSPQAARA